VKVLLTPVGNGPDLVAAPGQSPGLQSFGPAFKSRGYAVGGNYQYFHYYHYPEMGGKSTIWRSGRILLKVNWPASRLNSNSRDCPTSGKSCGSAGLLRRRVIKAAQSPSPAALKTSAPTSAPAPSSFAVIFLVMESKSN